MGDGSRIEGKARATGGNGEGDARVLALFHSEIDLVELHVRLAAKRLRTGIVTLDDMRSLAREGLLGAARTFDAGRGVPFRFWAQRRIHGAIADGLRRWHHTLRVRRTRPRAGRSARKRRSPEAFRPAWRWGVRTQADEAREGREPCPLARHGALSEVP
jgi:hypothetical protein